MGLIAVKLGMTGLFDRETGRRFAVTVLRSANCVALAKTQKSSGAAGLRVAFGKAGEKGLSKARLGSFKKTECPVRSQDVEIPWRLSNSVEVGQSLSVNLFKKGDFVDVRAVSKGKGFQGPMKRHNFSGLRASHGVSVSHRSHGSTGQRSFPGKVFKNKKMAGQMGNKFVSVQSLRVCFVDEDQGLFGVLGGVPGGCGGFVRVLSAVKKELVRSV